MTLAFVPRRTPQRHAVVQGAVVAYFSGLPYYHAHTVIYKKAPPNARTRMNFDAGHPTPHMGHKTPQPPQASAPHPMREPVHQQRMQAGIAGEHFPTIARCGIALKND